MLHLVMQLLRRRCAGPLNTVTHVDLTDVGLARIENLHAVPKLQTLVLRGNDITLVQNISVCHHLWHLDLGNNQVSDLDGLSKFVALGTLNLSLNNLTWNDLRHIRHMYILELSLHGNQKLDKDPYYRIHAIDCLPNVWMLDGRLITSAERVQVQHFFQDSAVSEHPVRHKLTKAQFVPSSFKKIQVHGIYGSKTTHFMMRFPTNGALNVDTDRRRLAYMAYNLQNDMELELQQRKMKLQCSDFMERLLEMRLAEREKCNVLLLLLVASLEFSLPHVILQDTLTITKLREIISDFDTLDLFAMAEVHRCRILSLLLSAVKVDRDDHKDGGLYDKLYLCLYYTVAELVKRFDVGSPKNAVTLDRTNPIYREYRSLLAAEVVQLLCIVPSFYDLLLQDSSLAQLVTQATGSASAMSGVEALMERIKNTGGGSHRTIEEISEYLMESIQRNTKRVLHKKISTKSSSNYVLETPRALPKRPQSSPVYASNFLAVGQPSPVGKPYSRPTTGKGIRKPHSHQASRPGTASSVGSAKSEHLPSSRSAQSRSPMATASPTSTSSSSQDVCRFPKKQEQWTPAKPPRLGDKVLLGPQNLAYIIALPEYDVALLQMESIPDLSHEWKAPNGSVVSFTRNANEHYAYMNMIHMEWDTRHRYWKPIGSVGDRITLQHVQNSFETKPPPTSPTSSLSPRSVDDAETETTHHTTPRESLESLPQSISMRFREKLRLSPEKILPIEEERASQERRLLGNGCEEEVSDAAEEAQKSDADAENVGDGEDKEEAERQKNATDERRDEDGEKKEGVKEEMKEEERAEEETTGIHGNDQEDEGKEAKEAKLSKEDMEMPEDTTLTEILSARLTEKVETAGDHFAHPEGDESLYSCLRCAMESIRLNNDSLSPPNTPTGSGGIYIGGATERSRNGAMVSQVAEVNTCLEHRNVEDIGSSPAGQSNSRPTTAVNTGRDSARAHADVKVVDLHIWPDPGVYTDYQRERTKVWDRAVNRPKSSTSVRSTDMPSRASSAKSRASTPASQGSPLLIQMGNYWLAGGRDIASWERVSNRMKTLHTPGWMEGTSLPRRPKSVGPYKYRQRKVVMQRRARSAVGPRVKSFSSQDILSSHPPPSPASTDLTLTDLQLGNEAGPSYLHQARQHNFTDATPGGAALGEAALGGASPASRPSSAAHAVRRPTTPPYGAPKKPSSPLHMTVKFL
ncbi:uncharacterized protein [Diadema setosum]|uniref:uncharacterized protein n=1 Tax=Diadema setosum TaxID=31175 RepID=UPI003B3AAE6A